MSTIVLVNPFCDNCGHRSTVHDKGECYGVVADRYDDDTVEVTECDCHELVIIQVDEEPVHCYIDDRLCAVVDRE